MRSHVVSAIVVVIALGAGAFYVGGAFGRDRVQTCSLVRVSGGNENAATGGEGVAAVEIENLSSRDCTISGHPWIRLGPLRHAVTVEDATRAVFGSNAGVPGHVLTIQPRERAYAAIMLAPGSCGQAKRQVFTLWMRGGWAKRSVRIGGLFCKDGSGEIWVGSFQPHL